MNRFQLWRPGPEDDSGGAHGLGKGVELLWGDHVAEDDGACTGHCAPVGPRRRAAYGVPLGSPLCVL